MELKEIQNTVESYYLANGYPFDVNVVFRGIVEELGELSSALNDMDVLYGKKKGRVPSFVRKELCDIFVYLIAFAIAQDIDLEKLIDERMKECFV